LIYSTQFPRKFQRFHIVTGLQRRPHMLQDFSPRVCNSNRRVHEAFQRWIIHQI
jgi:hypothetical protein